MDTPPPAKTSFCTLNQLAQVTVLGQRLLAHEFILRESFHNIIASLQNTFA